MSIIHTVGKGVAWSTVGTVLGKVFMFANIFIILRYLSVYDYGLGQLVLSVVSTLGILLLPGLASTIIADLGAERARGEFGRMKSIFRQFFSLSIVLSVVAWAILFFGSDIAAQLSGNSTIGFLLKIASFSLLATPLRMISMLLASVELRYFDQALYGIAEEAVKLVCLIIFFFWFQFGLSGLLYAIVISQFVTAVIYAPRSLSAYRVFSGASSGDPKAFWHIIREHRKWSIATSYIGTLGQNLQIWIIRLLLGTEAVGLFAFASGILGQVASFLPLGNILAPLLPRYIDKKADFARYVKSSIKAQVLFGALFAVAALVALPVLILIFPKYAPAVPIIMALIWSIIPASVVNIYTPAFAALKEQFAYFWSTVWKVFFILVFTPLSIMLWGIPGIGAGVVLFLLASMAERSWRLKRILPEFTFSFREFFVFDSYERTLIQKLLERWRVILAALKFR